jgi:outer membrane protein OmpA-like peptidoglycan-associated protein
MNYRMISLMTLSAALVACNSTPASNTALEQARNRLDSARRTPQVAALAPDELKLAGESVHAADQAWSKGAKPATVDHLAYLADKRVVIAQETAVSRSEQAITAAAAAKRDKMRLTARTNEADAAHQEADAAHQKVADLETQLLALNAKKAERGMVLTLGDVLFDTGKSQILRSGTDNLVKLADFFNHNPQARASIEGYTDNVGSEAANTALSERRSNAVLSALLRMGVPGNCLNAHAYGEENPVASNETPAGRQLNRRVEIVFATPPTEAAVN